MMLRFKKQKYEDRTDEQLIALLKEGDHGAFNELYGRYAPAMHQFFYLRMWKDAEKAEDFTHDLFAKLIKHPDAFDLSRSFKTWFYSIANNMVKNEYKRQQVRSNTHYIEDQLHISPSSEQDVANQVEEKLFASALDRELEKMDEKHRSVFELRHVLGLSVKEIADTLEINEGTVKSRIFYAVKKLSESLIEFKSSYE